MTAKMATPTSEVMRVKMEMAQGFRELGRREGENLESDIFLMSRDGGEGSSAAGAAPESRRDVDRSNSGSEAGTNLAMDPFRGWTGFQLRL